MPRFKNDGQLVRAFVKTSGESATRFDLCATCIELATTDGVIDGVVDMGFENDLKKNEPCGTHLVEVDEDMEDEKCEICFSRLTIADI
jgi:hypothetical protein